MKLTLFIAVFFMISCHDEGPVTPNPYWGQCTLELNNEIEIFKPYCFSYDGKFKIHFHGFNGTEFLRYELTFGNINRDIYVVDSLESFNGMNSKEYAVFFTLLADGDVLGKDYKLFNSDSNYFEITNFNDATGEITGNFSVNFVTNDSTGIDPLAPDTIRIRNGLFHARL